MMESRNILLALTLVFCGSGLLYFHYKRVEISDDLVRLSNEMDVKKKSRDFKWQGKKQVAIDDVNSFSSEVVSELKKRGVKSVSVDFIDDYEKLTGNFAVFFTKAELREGVCYQIIEEIKFIGDSNKSKYSVGQVYGLPEWLKTPSWMADAVAIYSNDHCSDSRIYYYISDGEILGDLDYRMRQK